MSCNKVLLVGRLGAAPELRYTQNGKPVTTLSVATSELDKQGKQETQWHRVTVLGKTAEAAAKALDKGSEVFVEGQLKYRDYVNKAGQKVYVTDIVTFHVSFLSGVQKQNTAPAGQPVQSFQPSEFDDVQF